jgi:hypothetical protein
MSCVRDLIANKQSDLANFVRTHAMEVVSADVDDAERGRLAVDMLRLLAATTAVQAPARPAVTIEQPPASFGEFVERETATIAYRGEAHRWAIDPWAQAAAKEWVPAEPAVSTRVSAGRGKLREPAPSPEAVAAVEQQAAFPETPEPEAAKPPRGGRSPKFTAQMISAAAALGGSVATIAARLGASEQTVRVGMKAAGIALPGVAPREDRKSAPPRNKRKLFSDGEIVAALELGGTIDDVAERIGCSRQVVVGFNKKHGRSHPRADRPVVSNPVQLPAVWVDANGGAWDAAARERLIELSKVEPRPSNEAIAFALGHTPAAVQTALSRFGVTRAGKLAISRLKDRPCITCRRAFLSEGPGNRMCTRCRARGDDAVAA